MSRTPCLMSCVWKKCHILVTLCVGYSLLHFAHNPPRVFLVPSQALPVNFSLYLNPLLSFFINNSITQSKLLSLILSLNMALVSKSIDSTMRNHVYGDVEHRQFFSPTFVLGQEGDDDDDDDGSYDYAPAA